jgi:hypothetical protein
MSGQACTSNIFSADNAADQIEILQSGIALWGVLEHLEPVGSGLIRVQVSGIERLVDDSLLSQLSGLIGKIVVIIHDQKWGAGAVTA